MEDSYPIWKAVTEWRVRGDRIMKQHSLMRRERYIGREREKERERDGEREMEREREREREGEGEGGRERHRERGRERAREREKESERERGGTDKERGSGNAREREHHDRHVLMRTDIPYLRLMLAFAIWQKIYFDVRVGRPREVLGG